MLVNIIVLDLSLNTIFVVGSFRSLTYRLCCHLLLSIIMMKDNNYIVILNKN